MTPNLKSYLISAGYAGDEPDAFDAAFDDTGTGSPLAATDALATDGALVLADVCDALSADDQELASAIIQKRYPFDPKSNAGRRYSFRELMQVFVRDGFIDRYSGKRLIFPGTLRLISRLMPRELPFHRNGKMDECHIAFWELFPTIDHILPLARGGPDTMENWITTSMLRNAAKANATVDELGWTILPRGDVHQWDGLAGWFVDWVQHHPSILDDPYFRRWHAAAIRSRYVT